MARMIVRCKIAHKALWGIREKRFSWGYIPGNRRIVRSCAKESHKRKVICHSQDGWTAEATGWFGWRPISPVRRAVPAWTIAAARNNYKSYPLFVCTKRITRNCLPPKSLKMSQRVEKRISDGTVC